MAEQRLQRAMQRRLAREDERVAALGRRLEQASPQRRLEAASLQRNTLARRLETAMRVRLRSADQQLRNAGRSLHAVSPLQTLERGYAIARDEHDHVVRSADTVVPGDRLHVDLARGRLDCEVRAVHAESGERST
jgi:exodeoxyribonuclease VII large subunit